MAWFGKDNPPPPPPSDPSKRHPRSTSPPPCDDCSGQGWTENEGLCLECGGTGKGTSD